MTLLNKESLGTLSQEIDRSREIEEHVNTQIMHIGVGGFHRSHQAYALARLLKLNSDQYRHWRITGVCLMPQDKRLVENLKAQDHLYTLKMVSSHGAEDVMVIDAIKEILHIDEDLAFIVQKIAAPEIKVISFTITEGGYNYDFDSKQFLIDNPKIQADLAHKSQPKTVFGLLAKGLQERMRNRGSALTLLSCDNIIGNGEVLRETLLSFLEVYDNSLHDWVKENVSFPNSMVDRITPVPSESEMNDFEKRFGIRDNCLVVSEDYFQWVIESGDFRSTFPPLEQVGVEFVESVTPYENMKLGVLNGGHTLVGFLGDALGYTTIHDAVVDQDIDRIYTKYVHEEVIPSLENISGVSFDEYFLKVKDRFANAMINDSVGRIQSFTSDKFPKFILPIIQQQLDLTAPNVRCAALIVASWWNYLNIHINKDNVDDVQDNLKQYWKELLSDNEGSELRFLEYKPVFGNLSSSKIFKEAYLKAVVAFKSNNIRSYLSTF